MKYENETFIQAKCETQNCCYIQKNHSLKNSGRDQCIINYRNIKYICVKSSINKVTRSH